MSENQVLKLKDQYHMTEKDFALLQKAMQENEEVGFESLEGYELPPRTQFTMTNKPAVSIKGNRMTFSMAAIRMFESYHYIMPMINPTTKRLSIIPREEEDSSTVEWSRYSQKTGKLQNKPIVSDEFIRKIFAFMDWNADCRYKLIGRLAYSEHGMILVFDLEEAIMFSPKKQEVLDPVTGKSSKKVLKYYPDRYKNCFGMTYNDYLAMKENERYEETSGYESIEYLGTNAAAELESNKSTDSIENPPAVIHKTLSSIPEKQEEAVVQAV